MQLVNFTISNLYISPCLLSIALLGHLSHDCAKVKLLGKGIQFFLKVADCIDSLRELSDILLDFLNSCIQIELIDVVLNKFSSLFTAEA